MRPVPPQTYQVLTAPQVVLRYLQGGYLLSLVASELLRGALALNARAAESSPCELLICPCISS